ncbi:entry exclusion lipoprotein TrbK [Yersinia enterocolitica]|nr:entry exclusion lipoprotein TrbK [Yersinia enterocolitica]EKN6091034.1 entry exclusion lipoprotein TrbK [Yersinia enterocolitica]
MVIIGGHMKIKKHLFLALTISVIGFLVGCDNPTAATEKQPCENKNELKKADQQAIASDCFRTGNFEKSPEKKW